MVGSLRIRV